MMLPTILHPFNLISYTVYCTDYQQLSDLSWLSCDCEVVKETVLQSFVLRHKKCEDMGEVVVVSQPVGELLHRGGTTVEQSFGQHVVKLLAR